MKKTSDPRHKRRMKTIQEIFTYQYNQSEPLGPLTQQVIGNLDSIDKLIEKAADQRPLGQINKIDLAILRLAIFELVIDKSAPYKVIVDEAVELAKQFGSTSSPAFVNGALGHLIKLEKLADE